MDTAHIAGPNKRMMKMRMRKNASLKTIAEALIRRVNFYHNEWLRLDGGARNTTDDSIRRLLRAESHQVFLRYRELKLFAVQVARHAGIETGWDD